MCFVTIQNRKRKYLAAIRISLEYILNPYSYTEILMNYWIPLNELLIFYSLQKYLWLPYP